MLSRLLPLVAILVVLVTGACGQTETTLPKLQIATPTQPVSTQVPPTFTPAATEPVSTPVVNQLMSNPDPSFRSCSTLRESTLTPIFSNEKVCIQVSNGTGSLKDTTFAWMFNFKSVEEMNSWVDQIGKWLKDQGINPCSAKTAYLISLMQGPLKGTEYAVLKDPTARFKPALCS